MRCEHPKRASALLMLALLAPLPLAHALKAVWPSTLATAVVMWALGLATLAWVFLVEKQGWAALGLARPGWRRLGLGLLAGLLIMLLFPLLNALLQTLGVAGSGGTLAKLAALSVWTRLVLVLTAGLVEEVFYRGFAIPRLQAWLGRPLPAALLPLLAFTAVHLGGWSLGHLLPVFTVGALRSLLYLWQRNLWPAVAAHLLIDTVGILLMPALANAPASA